MCKTGKKHDENNNTYNSYSDDDNFNVANHANNKNKNKDGYTYNNAFDYE